MWHHINSLEGPIKAIKGNLYTLLLNLRAKFWQIFQLSKASISRIRFSIISFMIYIIYVEVLGMEYL